MIPCTGLASLPWWLRRLRIHLQCGRPALEDPLEEGMASHSSILAWTIPMDRGA